MTNQDLSRELAAAQHAARAAGALLLAAFRGTPTVLSEEGRDIKLQADRDAEAVILEALQPFGYPALAEESGAHGDYEHGLAWAVDPLDGTLNFARGIPLNCVSIGLLCDLTPVVGVIYDFHHDEMFYAAAGHGAWLEARGERRPLCPTRHTDPLRTIYSVYPSGKGPVQRCSDLFNGAVHHFKRLRIPGSAALQLAWVAAGRYDLYSEDDIMLWDVAAGLAIASEAGAVYECKRSPYHPAARFVRCAANATLLELLLEGSNR